MNSPFTNKPMLQTCKTRIEMFRKEPIEYMHHFYRCTDTDNTFTTTDLDVLNTEQIHNQYRAKHNLPFLYEIQQIRAKYGLSAAKMSEILGLGANSFRHYENGEVPSIANGRLLQLIEQPDEFLKILTLSALDDVEKKRIKTKINHLLMVETPSFPAVFFERETPSQFNGYRSPSIERAFAVIAFFANALKPTKTKLNKLLFYADFGFYKQHATSLTGLNYRAIQFGPVPSQYDVLYTYAADKKVVTIETTEFNEKMSEQFFAISDLYNQVFNENERAYLQSIVTKFGHLNATKISEISHEEAAWQQAHEQRNLMDYQLAFQLIHI